MSWPKPRLRAELSSHYIEIMPNFGDDEPNLAWEKPSWATGGVSLKSTGRADKMKGDGNLAAPITSLPHQKETGPFQKPEWTGNVAASNINGDLAKPITAATQNANLAFQKPDWTKAPNVRATAKGDALKEGKEIARPIGGIKPIEG